MDITTYLEHFESSLSSYTGEDPLEPWDKFVEYLEKKLPADGGGSSSSMSVVFDRLVERFLDFERYANDIRYVTYCIKCAAYYSNPIALYSHVHSRGVGTKTAALYVAWAQQCEHRGMNEQADAVYQKAIENQAQPADAVLLEYRQFQAKTRSQTQASAGGRNPLQDSQLTNQTSSHRETVSQIKASVDCVPKQVKTTVIVSRSETSWMIPPNRGSGVQTVSAYNKDELVCEGSELCFEEVRAARYFCKKQEKELKENQELKLREQEGAILTFKSMLEKVNQDMEACERLMIPPSSHRQLPAVEPATRLNSDPVQQPSGHPPPPSRLSSRRSLGLRLHRDPALLREAAAVVPSEQHHRAASHHASVLADRSVHFPNSALASSSREPPTSMVPPLSGQQPLSFETLYTPACPPALLEDVQPQERSIPQRDVSQLQEPEEKLDLSQGASANLSHITPNNSLGFVQATPSRVLPSPTVNTREALDVIMDMFQAPTLLDDPFGNASVLRAAEKEPDAADSRKGSTFSSAKPPTTAPFTIFQDEEKENGCAAAAACEMSKLVRALAVVPGSKPDKPNDTPPDLMPDESTMWGAEYNSINSLAACPNSTTDFAMLAQFVSTPFTHKTPLSSNFYPDKENHGDAGDAEDDAFIRRQPKKLSPILEQSPSDEKLSQTAVSQIVPSSAGHGTIVGEGLASAQHCLTSSSITMVQPPPPAVLSFRDQTLCPTESSISRPAGPGWEVYMSPGPPVKPRSEPFEILEDLDRPGGPEQAQEPACDVPMSPECAVKPDWLAIRSPEVTVEPDLDAFMSPHQPRILDVSMRRELPQICADVPMSPTQPPVNTEDEPMMSPDKCLRPSAVPLVPDPWDQELVSYLLSTLAPPLASHPRCITWQCNVPSISPKVTLSMGKASLRVDCVLGQGAFATVYQATEPMTSEKVVLKVQKPANPWEFYINTQLDSRLQPAVRHLYSSIRSAHIFNNGSVLLGELHSYGTLLNAVNIYKTLSDKVMPQPLVMYFTVCILHMVEQLHGIDIIHADIKPDNFLLGDRFTENTCFGSDDVDHGLVLIDLGQSIDMQRFPEGAAFTARCLTSGFQCTEMLSGKPWNYQADYFGIAGTVYCMLFGTYMQVTNEGGVWRTNGVFRRNPHSGLWLDFFHTLLNVPDCSSLPSLRSLRCKLTSVLQQNYSSKLSTLRSRLVVLLLENRKAARK